MRRLAITAVVFLAIGCSGSHTVPTDVLGVRQVLQESLNLMAFGFEQEDYFLASQPVSERFTMNNNVAVRYHPDGWGEVQGVGKFREFLLKVFELHANIEQQFEITGVELNGELANANTNVIFNSARTDTVPPEAHTAPGEDLFIFEKENGAWKLIRWDEQPEHPEDHGEGVGEDV